MFKYSVSVAKPVKITEKEIWEKISTPGLVHLYHPFCKENPVEKWDEEGHVDLIKYENGVTYRRDFFNWYDGVGYDLSIIYKDRKVSDVYWRIEQSKEGLYQLRITLKHYPDAIMRRVPRGLRMISYYLFVHRQMRKYLEHVLNGFEFYTTSGNPVKPHQFGKHKFFSKKD